MAEFQLTVLSEKKKILLREIFLGAGGFARGMIEACEQEPKATHVILMDDDVQISPESVKRSFNLLSLVRDDYKEAFLSGAMLSFEQQDRFYEDVGCVRAGDGMYGPTKKDRNLSKLKSIVLQETLMEEAMTISYKETSQYTHIRDLSGGNQQKVIIGRWLLTNPEILLLDEPTRGIDVGAKYEIYQLILNLANDGKGIIMVSSEMPELLGICDRIAVLSNGILAGILDSTRPAPR